jgi:RNA methyltransferase, TrmH family
MLSPKSVKKLTDKKHRIETGLFIVEGEKNIKELLTSNFEIEGIMGTTQFINSIIDVVNVYDERMQSRIELKEIKVDELPRAGTFVTNTTGIAVVKQRVSANIDDVVEKAKNDIVLILDDIRDPGNLGTIIRIADWYGVSHIIASPTTTDFYNPKTIAASMGSFTRVEVVYSLLVHILKKAEELHIPIISADMAGENIHTAELPKTGFLLMGSESHGVSDESLARTTYRVTIPRFGKAESLNVSVATGILLDTLRR